MSIQYEQKELETYASALARVASLSNLFSESVTPFVHYRATEYLYARALNASNLARSDIAIDAKRGAIGIGLKTFVYGNKPKFEKIAEFNKEVETFDSLDAFEKIKRISELRNERITFAGRIANVDEFVYHCIARLPGKLFVFETPMPLIDIDKISITKIKGKNISFTDSLHNYRFSSSKSTLYKEFYSSECIFEKQVTIYEDPFSLLATLDFEEYPTDFGNTQVNDAHEEYVILPLYGYKADKVPFVFEGSGLNQWNANGRTRNKNEVYVPIPAEVHEKYPGFLPARDQPFDLHFPDGDVMQVKVCQENSKALMSQHNADLGKWLLRDVLNLKPGELVTYDQLMNVGIDSIEISKVNGEFHIDFKKLGSYEMFINS